MANIRYHIQGCQMRISLIKNFTLLFFLTLSFNLKAGTEVMLVHVGKTGCFYAEAVYDMSKLDIEKRAKQLRIEWSGGCKDGRISGPGLVKIFEGDYLISEIKANFVNGFAEGFSSLSQFDKNIKVTTYEGELRLGVFSGTGKFEDFSENITYQGVFRDDSIVEGESINRKQNSSYKGSFKNWLYEGVGTYVDKDGSYKGEFKENSFHGRGVYVDDRGTSFTGTFEKGDFVGRGVVVYKDGFKCVGIYKSYAANGIGECEDANYFEKGNYINNSLNGQAEIRWKKKGVTFSGNFKDGKAEGLFEITFSDGEKVKRKFANDLFEGKNLFDFADTYKELKQAEIKKKNDDEDKQYLIKLNKDPLFKRFYSACSLSQRSLIPADSSLIKQYCDCAGIVIWTAWEEKVIDKEGKLRIIKMYEHMAKNRGQTQMSGNALGFYDQIIFVASQTTCIDYAGKAKK